MAPATALKDAIKNFEAAKGVKAAETEKVRPCLELTVGAWLPQAQPRTPRSVRRDPLANVAPPPPPTRNSVARMDLRSSSTARSLPS